MSGYFSLLAPEIVLVVGAMLVLLAGLSRRRPVQISVPWLAVLCVIVAIGWVWRGAPPSAAASLPGVELSLLSWYVRLLGLAIGLTALLINLSVPPLEEAGEYFAMILFSLAGVLLTATADDLILLFLALELVSVPTYALVAAGSSDIRSQEAGVKYFFLGALAAAVLAYGLSFLYGGLGTAQLSAMAGLLEAGHPFLLFGLMLTLAGLAFKIAAVPMHFYVADVYQGAASPIAGLLGFFPKFAGFVAILRVLALVPAGGTDARPWVPPDVLFWTLWILAAATMTVGNCLALFQTNVKRILAYSGIAHSGYMLVALLVGPAASGGPMRDGWSALLFYVSAYGIVNLGAFGVLAYVRLLDRPAEDLEDLAGLSRLHPGAALALALCVFSLMGMPPTVGFFGKFYVFAGALSVGSAHSHATAMTILAVVGVLNSALAAAYYLRILAACYLHEPREVTRLVSSAPLRLGLAICAAFVVMVGLWPRELSRLADFATVDLPPKRRIVLETSKTPPPDHTTRSDSRRSAPGAEPTAHRECSRPSRPTTSVKECRDVPFERLAAAGS